MSINEPDRMKAMTARVVVIVLCLAVSVIHVIDQEGIPGTKEPGYLAAGYWVLEVVAVVAAIALVASRMWLGWLLAAAVALGPLVGYALSRGIGLPGYTDDIGNWTEPIGVVSLVNEGLLLVISVAVLAQIVRRRSLATARVASAH
jgi:hypothetical protein